jgi:[acyl-carrier-protein] S-malonyltransferase
MNRAAQGLSEVLAHVPLRDPEIPVVANITGQALHTADEIRRELAENVVKPVNWTRSVLEMVNGGGRTFVEVGPGKVLSGLIQRISNDVKAVNVQEVRAEHLPLGSAGARASAPARRPVSTRRSQETP